MLKTDRERLLTRSGAFLRAFARDEEGGIIILTLLLLFTMLVMGGMAVDFMRYESERAELQSVSDRAVLAAANNTQSISPSLVVQDFFKAAGFEDKIVGVPFAPGRNSQGLNVVRLQSAVDMDTFYLRLIGIDMLEAPAQSEALAGLSKVEISLVLDISGSMRFGGSGSDGKFGDMQRAAKAFAANVLDDSYDGQVSLTIVPYAGHVNAGPEMFDYLEGVRYNANLTTGGVDGDSYDGDGSVAADPNDNFPNVSSCLEMTRDDRYYEGMPGPLTPGDGDPALIDAASAHGRAQVPHFMNWGIAASVMDWGWCPLDRSAIRYAIKDYCVAEKFIDGIRMHDGTGTQYGMKYGLAALSPDSRDAFAELSGMPASEIVNPDYTPSAACVDYWSGGGTGAIGDGFDADGGATADGDGTGAAPATVSAGTVVPVEFSDRPANWDDVETNKILVLMTDGAITPQFRPIDIFHEDLLTRTLWSGNKRTHTSTNTNVQDFYAMCNMAKSAERNVSVFTVAFEANSAATTQMRNCASDPSMFFPAAGAELTKVFDAIAAQIIDLRLSL